MPSDSLTFFIGFAAIFGVLGWYLWHLERQVAGLRQRVADAEHAARDAGPASGRVEPAGAAAARAEQAHIERDAAPMVHGTHEGHATTVKDSDREDAP